MARPRTITDDKKLLIALMHTERHMTKKEIAAHFTISPSAVTKVIQECFAEGRLRLVFNRDGLSAQELDLLQTTVTGAAELRDRLAKLPKDDDAVIQDPEVRVFDSGCAETTPAAFPIFPAIPSARAKSPRPEGTTRRWGVSSRSRPRM